MKGKHKILLSLKFSKRSLKKSEYYRVIDGNVWNWLYVIKKNCENDYANSEVDV